METEHPEPSQSIQPSLTKNIVPERIQKLTKIADLPRESWIAEVNKLYPKVIIPGQIDNDLQRLDQIAVEVSKENRGINRLSIGCVSLVGMTALAGITFAFIDHTAGIGVGTLTFLAATVTLFTTSPLDNMDRYGIYTASWNTRGQNWLHSERDRIFSKYRH